MLHVSGCGVVFVVVVGGDEILLLLQCSSCLTWSDILENVLRQHLHEYFLTLA